MPNLHCPDLWKYLHTLDVWLNTQFYHTFLYGMCLWCGSACNFQKTCNDHIGETYRQPVIDQTFSVLSSSELSFLTGAMFA